MKDPGVANNALTRAFQGLRDLGYFARQNFKCCQGCGWAAAPKDRRDKAVFYHAQDNEDRIEGKPVFLSWSGDGNEIVTALRAHGLTVEWDGDPNTRILVKQ